MVKQVHVVLFNHFSLLCFDGCDQFLEFIAVHHRSVGRYLYHTAHTPARAFIVNQCLCIYKSQMNEIFETGFWCVLSSAVFKAERQNNKRECSNSVVWIYAFIYICMKKEIDWNDMWIIYGI
jgi:hypothetical protein